MRNKLYYLFFFFIILFSVSSAQEIIWRWPFDSQPYFNRARVLRRHGDAWYKLGWAIPQDGTFGAPRDNHPHWGIDILAERGTRIKAVASGEAFYAGKALGDGAGIKVWVYYPSKENPQYIVRYFHLSEYAPYLDGASEAKPIRVNKNGSIGKVGITPKPDMKDGPHLHLQVERYGISGDEKYVNPLTLLQDTSEPTAKVNYVISNFEGKKKKVFSRKKGNLFFPVVKGRTIFGFELMDDTIVEILRWQVQGRYDSSVCRDKKIWKSLFFGPYRFDPNNFRGPDSKIFHYFPEWKGVFLTSRAILPSTHPSPSPEDLKTQENKGVDLSQFDIYPWSLPRFSFNTKNYPNGDYHLVLAAGDYQNYPLDRYKYSFKVKNDEETKGNPGCENPDDNFSFAEPVVSNVNLTSDIIRIAAKKDKKRVLQFIEKQKELSRLNSELDEYIKSLPIPEEEGDFHDDVITDPVYVEYLKKLNFIYDFIQSYSYGWDQLVEECADVALLWHGKYHSTRSFLSDLHIPSKLIDPDFFSPLLVNEYPVLVIPTGGLYGLDNAEQFKAALEQYASLGGTILTFTQKYGYEFAMLPTPGEMPLASYGWKEDQSCHTNSIYMGTYHPALSAVTTSLVTSPVDGYLTQYPSSSTVLLRRRISGMPAMIVYPYGQGRVAVTSLYEDWGYTHWQSTAQGRAIIRDLINWAKDFSSDIPEYNLRSNPTPEASLSLEIKNLSEKAAARAKILWLSPDLKLHFEEENPVSLPAGGETTLPVTHTFNNIPDNKLGIWHVDYSLYDSDGNEIQPQVSDLLLLTI